MSSELLTQTIGQLVAERPGRARVFETFGIDYCCGGKQQLKEACEAKGVNPQTVLSVLQMLDEKSEPAERDWTKATLSELCDNIEQTHHAYLKRDLPRMEYLVCRVADRHGERHSHLLPLRDTFLGLKREMETHMQSEEQQVFPACRKLDEAGRPSGNGYSFNDSLRQMIAEHADAGVALAKMRQLTDGYSPPADACNTFRAMYDALAELERDMHRHVHKENSILFPRAAEMELKLPA